MPSVCRPLLRPWLAAGLALACGCGGDETGTLLQVQFVLPRDTTAFSGIEYYEARLDYLGGDKTGTAIEYTLDPDDPGTTVHYDLHPTDDPGETLRVTVQGVAAGSSGEEPRIITRALSGRFVLPPEGPTSISLFMGVVQALNELADPLTLPRTAHTATLLPDGTVLIAGGAADDGKALASVERFDSGAVSQQFGPMSSAAAMQAPRVSHTATLLSSTTADLGGLEGLLLIAGGDPFYRLEFTRIAVPDDPSQPDKALVLPLLDLTLETPPLETTELFDPLSGAFAAGPSFPAGLTLHQATLLNDGDVLFCGGLEVMPPEGDGSATLKASPSCYRFNEGELEVAPAMRAPRLFHQMTLLEDGQVLITGGLEVAGFDAESIQVRAELYSPGTTALDEPGSMSTGRFGHSATRLPDGRVLLTGGYGRIPVSSGPGDPQPTDRTAVLQLLASAETFDLRAGTGRNDKPFRFLGTMHHPRAFHSSILLPDGTVLIVGGVGEDLSTPLPAELYDPREDKFIDLGSNTESGAALGLAATPLETGSLLLTGGRWYEGSSYTANRIRLYVPTP